MKHRIIYGIKAALTVLLLAYVSTKLDWVKLGDYLRTVNLTLFFLAFAAMSLPIALTSLRWQFILRAQKIILPIRLVLSFDLTALFFNSFLPGATGGDAARAYYAIRLYPSEKTRVLTSILFDRGVGLIVLLTFGYAALLVQPAIAMSPGYFRNVAVYLPPLLAATVCVSAIYLFLPSSSIPPRLRAWIKDDARHGILRKLVLFIQEQRTQPVVFAGALAISAVSTLANFLSAFLLARALGLDVTFYQIVLIITLMTLAISVPVSLGGHGVREVVVIALFTTLDIVAADDIERAISYSVLLVSVQLLWSLLGGCWYLLFPPPHYYPAHDSQPASE